jgi:hypothetical protein
MNTRIPQLIFIIACFSSNIAIAQPNTLTEKEKQNGWQLLFDGKDLQGWHSYMQNKPGKAWQVENGMIFLNKNNKSVYEDFRRPRYRPGVCKFSS